MKFLLEAKKKTDLIKLEMEMIVSKLVDEQDVENKRVLQKRYNELSDQLGPTERLMDELEKYLAKQSLKD